MQTTYHTFDVDIHLKSSDQKVKINQDFIAVNNSKIACKNVTSLRYGVSLVGPRKKPVMKRYAIDVKGKDGETLHILFNSNKVQDLLEEDHTYYYIMSGIWQYIKKALINGWIDLLNEQHSFQVENLEITHEGIKLPVKSWLFGKTRTELLLWHDLDYHVDKGILHIGSLSRTGKKTALKLHTDWNAVCLNTLLHYLWQEHRKDKLAAGEKIIL